MIWKAMIYLKSTTRLVNKVIYNSDIFFRYCILQLLIFSFNLCTYSHL